MQCEKGWFIETGSTGTACLFLHRSQRVFCPGCLSHTHFVSSREDKGIKLCVRVLVRVCVQYERSVVVTDGCLLVSVRAWQPSSPSLSLSLVTFSLSGWPVFHPSVSLSLCNSAKARKLLSAFWSSNTIFSAQFRGLKAGQEECVSNET